MKSVTAISAICIFLVLSLAYQNCGSGFRSRVESSSIQSLPDSPLTQDEPSLVSPGGNFVPGDKFDYKLVPYKSAFVAALISQYDYANYSDRKAVAIAASGLGYVSYGRGIDIEEVKKQALESCNLIAGGPCAVIAEDDKFITSTSTLDSAMSFALPGTGRKFDPAEMPVVGPSRDNPRLKDYLDSTSSTKAIAISPSGFYSYYFPDDKLNYSQAEVNRRVLQHCELSAAITPCTLYAAGNVVVYAPGNWDRMSSIDFSITDAASVAPYGAAQSYMDLLNTDYFPKLDTMKGAIYLSRNGGVAFKTNASADTAKNEAHAACQADNGDGTCFLYALDDKIAFKPTQLLANSTFSGIYCKVPRTSCAEHKLVGCDKSGEYWVLNDTNEVTKTTCKMDSPTP